MGFFTIGKRKKKYLLEWQNILINDNSDSLIMSEHQLQQLSNQQINNDLRIIQDCIKIINATENPNTFFSRLDLLKQKGLHLIKLEPYIKFTGSSPSTVYREVIDQEQEAIYNLISRCYTVAFEKSEKLKTEKGKKDQFLKFYNSLLPYTNLMNEHNLNYLNYKIRNKL